jgi:hypothetical protein
MWVSTGNAGTPNACDMTTEAVLCPTPGSSSNNSTGLPLKAVVSKLMMICLKKLM